MHELRVIILFGILSSAITYVVLTFCYSGKLRALDRSDEGPHRTNWPGK